MINCYFCNTGCSLVWLKYSSGGREIGGSNPLIPTMLMRIQIVIYLFSSLLSYSQNGCAGIYIGEDTTIDCSQSCITIKSEVLDIGQSNNYRINSLPYNPPFSFSIGNTIFVNQDDIFSQIIQLPFSFCFYGIDYDKIVVGANGIISFDLSLENSRCEWNFNQTIPNISNQPYRNSINGPYHDLDPSQGGNVRYSVTGSFPCRTFIVNFENVPHFDCTNITSTFQIILYETTNIIEIYISEKPVCNFWNNGNSVLGIQNQSGSIAHVPLNRNTSNWSANNEAWQFVPSNGSIISNISWFKENGQFISSGDSIQVCPNDSTKFFANLSYTNCKGNQILVYDTISVNVTNILNPKIEINSNDTTVCEGDSIMIYVTNSNNFIWNNGIIDSTFFYPTQSDYFKVSSIDSNGCFSADSIKINVNNSFNNDTNIRACDSILWNGSYYKITGTYSLINTTIYGCDSIDKLNLIIDESSTSLSTVSSCNNFLWNNNLYDSTGIYYFKTQNSIGCDSTAFLDLEINYPKLSVDTVIYCDQFIWNNQNYSNSGTFSFLTRSNDGCDSTAILNLTILNSSSSFLNISSCGPFLWNGQQYNSSGQYLYQTNNSVGCDSTAILNLTINNNLSSVTNTSSCDQITWNNQIYTTSGIHSFTSIGSNGCDSTAYLYLTINKTTFSANNIVSCKDVYWNGSTYDSTGTYEFYTTNSNGCDSIATLNLLITPKIFSSDSVVSCDSFYWNGQNYDSTGTYSFITTTLDGCDSIANLYLKINKKINSVIDVSACDNFLWNNNLYQNTGSYFFDTLSSLGCDSTAQLNLTINRSTFSESIVSSCESYFWNDSNYYYSGKYEFYTINSIGCDSVAILDLKILPLNETFFDTSICLGQTIEWNGKIYENEGVYSNTEIGSNGCDSISYLNLKTLVSTTTNINKVSCDEFFWNDMLLFESGTYSHISGNGSECDSLYILNLTINKSSFSNDTIISCNEFLLGDDYFNSSGDYIIYRSNNSGCDSLIFLNLTIEEINSYLPNSFTPNSDKINDFFPNFNLSIDDYEINIYNRNGEKVFTSKNSYIGWDGKYENRYVPDGSYVWKLKYRCNGKLVLKSGHVTIIK